MGIELEDCGYVVISFKKGDSTGFYSYHHAMVFTNKDEFMSYVDTYKYSISNYGDKFMYMLVTKLIPEASYNELVDNFQSKTFEFIRNSIAIPPETIFREIRSNYNSISDYQGNQSFGNSLFRYRLLNDINLYYVRR